MHADHLRVIDYTLEQCTRHAETAGREGLSHVIFEMPPRHGKTQTISRLYPAWHLGKFPDHRVILASYGATLAYRNSRYARNLLATDRYRQVFGGVELDPGSRAVDTWELAGHEGGMDAAGVGGGLTGKGGHIIIVDDPVKSREEAESETYRDKVYHWFTEDLYSRREPGAAVIVVMTRWHMDDLVGRLLRDDRRKWERIRFPAIAEPADQLGRAEGDALWPDRYPLDVLRDIEATMGPYPWAALYQQNPVPAEGGVFKRAWFSTVQRMFIPGLTQVVRFWDLAMSSKTAADFTVGVLMGMGDDGRIYVLDVKRIQAEWGDVVPFVAQVALEDGPGVQIGVEEAGYTSRAVQELQQDARLHSFGIWGYPVDKDKLTRALPFAARCAAGNVSVVEAGFTGAYLDEMCSFDKGAHDDQVDASSGAYAMLDGGLFEGGLNIAENVSYGFGTY
jgi:predicted phage terminase large subunit-like protein